VWKSLAGIISVPPPGTYTAEGYTLNNRHCNRFIDPEVKRPLRNRFGREAVTNLYEFGDAGITERILEATQMFGVLLRKEILPPKNTWPEAKEKTMEGINYPCVSTAQYSHHAPRRSTTPLPKWRTQTLESATWTIVP
jgi:hypothetical protein